MNKIIFNYYGSEIEIKLKSTSFLDDTLEMRTTLTLADRLDYIVNKISKTNGTYGSLVKDGGELTLHEYSFIVGYLFGTGGIVDELFSVIAADFEKNKEKALLFQMALARFNFDKNSSKNDYSDQLIYTL